MQKIQTIGKAELVALREPLAAELVALGERLGVKFKIGSGSYSADGTTASLKLELVLDDPARQAEAAKERFAANCAFIGRDFSAPEGTTGLRPEDFGTEFVANGVRYRVAGLELKRSKYPIRAEVLSGPKAGKTLLFGELAVPTIRLATDAKVAALELA